MVQAPEIKVFDLAFNLIGLVDTYSSLQAERRLWEVGALELHIALKAPYADVLQLGYILYLDSTRVWQITERVETDAKNQELVIRGRELKGLVSQRVVLPDAKDDKHYFGYDRFPAAGQPDASAEAIIKHYVNKHCIASSDLKRRFPGLVLEQNIGRGPKLRWSARFSRLDETLAEIGEYTGIGYLIKYDPENSQMVFDVIPERNRTQNSSTPVIFSPDFENMVSLTRERTLSDYHTLAFAGGPGEDENRLIQAVSRTTEEAELAGFNRIETWLDVGSAADITDLQYEAKYQLSKEEKTDTFTGQTSLGRSFPYLEAWDLGDLVTLRSTALGIEMDTKITAVMEVYEKGQIDIRPTFGKRKKDFRDVIKKRKVIR